MKSTKTVNGMILDINDSIAEHLLKMNLNFYDLYQELRSNFGCSLCIDGIETITLTDNSEVIVDINRNEITLA